MKTTILVLFTAILAMGQSPDLKRNQKLQQLTHTANVAVHAKQAFIDAWVKDCQGKGKQLISVDINEVDCVELPKPPVQPPVAATPATPAPASK